MSSLLPLKISFLVRPSDDDFIEKITNPSPDVKRAFETDSLSLSQAVFFLRGYYAGRWLDEPDNLVELIQKLPNVVEIYHKAIEAIRGRKLEAKLEEKIYYVRFHEFAVWAFEKGLEIHPSINHYVCTTFGPKKPKKRGRKTNFPDVITNISDFCRAQSLTHVTAQILVKNEAAEIQEGIKKYTADIKPTQTSQISRRIKKLAENVSKILKSTSS